MVYRADIEIFAFLFRWLNYLTAQYVELICLLLTIYNASDGFHLDDR